MHAMELRARRVVGYMYRTFAPYRKPDTIISLYKSQVLPILDYTSVVWEPHLKKDKLLLEAVQLQATRMASRQWKENSVSLNQRFERPSLIAGLDCGLDCWTGFRRCQASMAACVVDTFASQGHTDVADPWKWGARFSINLNKATNYPTKLAKPIARKWTVPRLKYCVFMNEPCNTKSCLSIFLDLVPFPDARETSINHDWLCRSASHSYPDCPRMSDDSKNSPPAQ